MRHEYIGKVPSDEEQQRQTKRDRLDAQWKQARIDAELARQKVHAVKLLELKGELIPRQLVQKQAAFLVLSLRGRFSHSRQCTHTSCWASLTSGRWPAV